MPDSAEVDMPGSVDRKSQLFLAEAGSHVGHSNSNPHSHHLHLGIDELELGIFLVALSLSLVSSFMGKPVPISHSNRLLPWCWCAADGEDHL
jgi:hypothetical protein